VKAIRVEQFGGPEVLKLVEIPTPTAGPGTGAGALCPVIGKEFPLAEAPQAHRAVVEPGALGKIVLVT
jgi:NADPH:quinone reductase-like Zn-dependent oxidoreductase